MKVIYIVVLIALGSAHENLLNAATHDTQSWTWLYHKRLTHADHAKYQDKDEILFAKVGIPAFNHLVFTWNAHRPSNGHYIFWVSARNAVTKKWGSWHKMMQWGSGVQQSFKNKYDDFSRYEHVRLEVNEEHMADGFRVRIARHEAPLHHIKALTVSISNFKHFQTEVDMSSHFDHASLHIKDVPLISQFSFDHPRSDAICSPTSTMMLLNYLLQKKYDPHSFVQKAYDHGLGVYGSWPFNMAHAFEMSEGVYHFFTSRLKGFDALHERLAMGLPVVVSVRGPLKGAASAYRYGHLLVVVGWDKKNKEVICHDPAFKSADEVEHRYPVKEFLAAWERSKRLAYIAEQV